MSNGRCKFHGGRALRGPDHPGYKDGRYSRYRLGNLTERVQAAAADPDMLAQRDEIAILTARLGELLERVEARDARKAWDELRARWRAFTEASKALETAQQNNDEAGRARANDAVNQELAAIGDAIRAGAREYDTWAQIENLMQSRRKLIESERRREVESQQVVALSQVAMLVDALAEEVRAHVEDVSIRRAIAVGFARLLGGAGLRAIDGGNARTVDADSVP